MAVDPNFEIPQGDIPLADPLMDPEGINNPEGGVPPITPGGEGSI